MSMEKSRSRRRFPYVPKSSVGLEAGDYWAIPLADSSWACGRVLQAMPPGTPGGRVAFLGGLMKWHDAEPPTSDSIAGAALVEQGVMHILSITSTGGAVLGNRPLELDGLEPLLAFYNGMICRGFEPLRPWTKADGQTILGLGHWGYDVIQIRANALFTASPPSKGRLTTRSS